MSERNKLEALVSINDGAYLHSGHSFSVNVSHAEVTELDSRRVVIGDKDVLHVILYISSTDTGNFVLAKLYSPPSLYLGEQHHGSAYTTDFSV